MKLSKMVNKKLIGMLVSFIVITIFLVHNVEALGISPGRKTFNFESNLKETVEFKILNNDHRDMQALIYVEGDLAEYVALQDVMLNIKASDDFKMSKYEIRLPSKIEKPGTHEARIVVREVPVDAAIKGSHVGATASVVTQLHVIVPYPGKYAEVELKISETGAGQPLTFIVPVNNYGTQNIVKAKGIIDIYGPTNDKITSLETDSLGIKSKERGELVTVWEGDINPGKYFVIVTVTYDGETATAEKVFSVGDLAIDILDVTVKDYKLGGIAKFNILVESKWAEDLADVYAEMTVTQNGDEIIRFKSASETVKALAKEELIAYWDTEGIKEGTYDAKLALYYGDRSTERELKAIVSLNSIEVSFIGATGKAVGLTSSSLNKDSMYMIALFLLIGINVAWFAYFKRRNKK